MPTYYTRFFRPYTFVLITNVIYLVILLAINDADPKTFVTLGDCFKQCNAHSGEDCDKGTEGYDGQFAYYIARDPSGSENCLDVPAYRFQRILLPALGYVLSLGNETLIPWVFVLVNLAALVISTHLLEDLLVEERVSRWFALSYGLFIGVFMAVRLSTTEALAYGLVIVALWFGQRNHPIWTAIMLALAGLAKETTGVFTAGYLLYFVLNRRWWDTLRMGLIVGVPFAAWQIALYRWFGEFGIGSGGALATPFEIIPYMGVWRIALEGGILVFAILGLLVIPAAVLPSGWALWRTYKDLMRHKKYDLYVCLLLANAAIMPFVPFSTYREFLGLLRFIPGLVLMIVLYSARHKRRRPLIYSTLWIPLVLFVVSG